jgi:hypothetical protein
MVEDIRREFEAKGEKMKLYLLKVQDVQSSFKKFYIMKIPWEENEKANRLAWIASTTNGDMEESEEPDQILSQPSITEIVSILVSATEVLPEWKMEIVEYLEKGILPPNKKLAI